MSVDTPSPSRSHPPSRAPPKLPLPPLPGSRLSFDPTAVPPSPFKSIPMGYPGSSGSASTATTLEDDEYQYSNDSHDSSPASTSPSSLTPTLPVTPKQEDKQLTFPSSTSKSSPFPTTRKKTPFRRRPSREETEEEEAEDCGCGSPPEGFDDSEADDFDVLDFVLRDQELALKATSSPGQKKAVGETGLGLFKRPGVEGLSLTPGSAAVEEGGPPPALSKPIPRRPSTAPAAISTDSSAPPLPSSPTPRSRTRTISNLIPRLRLPRPGSSESDDSTDEERGDSDETMPGQPKRRRKKSQKKQFDRFMMPSDEDLLEARQCELVGETGVTVTLDELIKQRGTVVFVGLRHFWCNLCQQYVQALRETMLSLVAFQESTDNLSTTASSVSVGEYHEPRAIIPPIYIVLVSTGSYRLIPTYRQRLDCPFPLYVDRSRKLYKALGMTKSSLNMGKEGDKGSYIKNSNWENMVNSTKNGIAMPRYPGPQAQLGGEFVFTYNKEDDSVKCDYASRMHTTRAHSEIRELFAAAGVQLNDDDAQSVYGESMYSHAS